MGSESSEIFSASAAGLDTSSTGKRWLSKVNVPELEGESARYNQNQRLKRQYVASKFEGRHRVDKVRGSRTVPA